MEIKKVKCKTCKKDYLSVLLDVKDYTDDCPDCDNNKMEIKQIPNKKMSFNEFMDSEGKTIIDDFLIDNKEFDRICKESYEEYLN